MLIKIAEITPETDYGRKDCPYNCKGCVYFKGLLCGQIFCTLEEEPKED